MGAYAEAYLDDVVENQGKLFDYVAQTFPDMDTEDFINTYMMSQTRKSIDEAQAYVNTMDAKELWNYFLTREAYHLKKGKALEGRILCLLSVVLQCSQYGDNKKNTIILYGKGILWIT